MRYDERMRRILIAILASGLLVACNATTAPVDDNYAALPADQVAYGVAYTTTESGIRRAELLADTTLMFNDSAVVDLRGVHLELYDEAGRHQATLTSRTGDLNRSTNKMVARGDGTCELSSGAGCVVLVVHGSDGSTIWTEELHYDPSEHRIWSDVRTRRRLANGQEFQGQSFTADDEFRNVTIRGISGSGLRLDF